MSTFLSRNAWIRRKNDLYTSGKKDTTAQLYLIQKFCVVNQDELLFSILWRSTDLFNSSTYPAGKLAMRDQAFTLKLIEALQHIYFFYISLQLKGVNTQCFKYKLFYQTEFIVLLLNILRSYDIESYH